MSKIPINAFTIVPPLLLGVLLYSLGLNLILSFGIPAILLAVYVFVFQRMQGGLRSTHAGINNRDPLGVEEFCKLAEIDPTHKALVSRFRSRYAEIVGATEEKVYPKDGFGIFNLIDDDKMVALLVDEGIVKDKRYPYEDVPEEETQNVAQLIRAIIAIEEKLDEKEE